MKFSSLYVTAHNMNRAVEFYKKLFSKEPVIHEERFSSFDLDGFGFDIFAAAVDKEEIILGNNTIPVFYTEDLNKDKKRITELGQEITLEQQVNGYDIFQFKDPEGNIIEVYTKIS